MGDMYYLGHCPAHVFLDPYWSLPLHVFIELFYLFVILVSFNFIKQFLLNDTIKESLIDKFFPCVCLFLDFPEVWSEVNTLRLVYSTPKVPDLMHQHNT